MRTCGLVLVLPLIAASCSAAVSTDSPSVGVEAPKRTGPLEGYFFPAVYFEAGKATLSARRKADLADMGSAFRRAGILRLVLTRHADKSGNERINQRLSLERAKAVAAELMTLGYKLEDITVIGVGSTQPRFTDPNKPDPPFERFVLLQNRD